MLLLQRNLGEKIIINDDISIKIVKINKNCVKLGIEAPENVTVHREEIYNKILKEGNKLNIHQSKDKKCKWIEEYNDGDTICNISCNKNKIFYENHDYIFCPFCGKEIELTEEESNE
jgi:carbon storage regulator